MCDGNGKKCDSKCVCSDGGNGGTCPNALSKIIGGGTPVGEQLILSSNSCHEEATKLVHDSCILNESATNNGSDGVQETMSDEGNKQYFVDCSGVPDDKVKSNIDCIINKHSESDGIEGTKGHDNRSIPSQSNMIRNGIYGFNEPKFDRSRFFKPLLRVERLTETAIMPEYANNNDSGMDVFLDEELNLKSGERGCFKTGIRLLIPVGYEIVARPKSGLAIEKGITLVNTPGTIDEGYRGEVMMIVINHSDEDVHLSKGSKLAQLVIQKFTQCHLIEVDSIDTDTNRSTGGMGSTGLKSKKES